MNLLSLEQAQKSYGEKVLLKQANFYLNEGEKVGIIGINGTGKTTLLRILQEQKCQMREAVQWLIMLYFVS